MNDLERLTSVRLCNNIDYQEFKTLIIRNDMTLQKLVNRSLFLYITDPSFRELIDTTMDLQVSGSSY